MGFFPDFGAIALGTASRFKPTFSVWVQANSAATLLEAQKKNTWDKVGTTKRRPEKGRTQVGQGEGLNTKRN